MVLEVGRGDNRAVREHFQAGITAVNSGKIVKEFNPILSRQAVAKIKIGPDPGYKMTLRGAERCHIPEDDHHSAIRQITHGPWTRCRRGSGHRQTGRWWDDRYTNRVYRRRSPPGGRSVRKCPPMADWARVGRITDLKGSSSRQAKMRQEIWNGSWMQRYDYFVIRKEDGQASFDLGHPRFSIGCCV